MLATWYSTTWALLRLPAVMESEIDTMRHSFGVSQTEGTDLPELHGRSGDPSEQSDEEEFSTLMRELAHEMLHRAERRTATTIQFTASLVPGSSSRLNRLSRPRCGCQ